MYLLLPEAPGFPTEGLCGTHGVSHFYTVGSNVFGPNIFDLNYFHTACSTPAEDGAALAPCPPGCSISVFQAYINTNYDVGTAAEVASAIATVASPPAAPTPPPLPAVEVEKLQASFGTHLTKEDVSLALALVDGNLFRAEELIRCANACAAAAAGVALAIPGGVGERGSTVQQRVAAADNEKRKYVKFAHLALSSLGPAAADAVTAANVLQMSDWSVSGVKSMCDRVQSARRWGAKVDANIRFEIMLAKADVREATAAAVVHAAAAIPTDRTALAVSGSLASALAPSPPPPRMLQQQHHDRPWIVIVAGESPGSSFATAPDAAAGTPGRPGADLSGHTSMLHVGHAYQQLVPLVGRSRIIVIAQLEETMEWLEKCTASPDACRRMTGIAPHRSADSLLASNRRRLAKMREDCACLIADGGADYDREAVNPSTVVRVLTGEPLCQGDKVVPKGAGKGCSSVILLMYSHGGCHSRRYVRGCGRVGGGV